MARKQTTIPQIQMIQWFQLIVLAIGVGGFFVDLGKRSQILNKTTEDLSELRLIVQDLVKAQIQVSSNDAAHRTMLDDLKVRVFELERRK
jgi:hypothetical protein